MGRFGARAARPAGRPDGFLSPRLAFFFAPRALLLMTIQAMNERTAGVPVLTAGDRLTRAEFERRYAAMPHCKKAELVEGVVYLPSPVTHTRHGNPHSLLAMWLRIYRSETPGTECSDNATVRLDLDNEPQPDLLLSLHPACGGRAAVGADGYFEGPPELVVEVTASRVSYDLHDKLRAYRRNGVREYLVWRVDDGAFDWFELHDGDYRRLATQDGSLRSGVFPGLWLDPAAALRGDDLGVRSTLELGLASPEHGAFVAALQQRRGG